MTLWIWKLSPKHIKSKWVRAIQYVGMFAKVSQYFFPIANVWHVRELPTDTGCMPYAWLTTLRPKTKSIYTFCLSLGFVCPFNITFYTHAVVAGKRAAAHRRLNISYKVNAIGRMSSLISIKTGVWENERENCRLSEVVLVKSHFIQSDFQVNNNSSNAQTPTHANTSPMFEFSIIQ